MHRLNRKRYECLQCGRPMNPERAIVVGTPDGEVWLHKGGCPRSRQA